MNEGKLAESELRWVTFCDVAQYWRLKWETKFLWAQHEWRMDELDEFLPMTSLTNDQWGARVGDEGRFLIIFLGRGYLVWWTNVDEQELLVAICVEAIVRSNDDLPVEKRNIVSGSMAIIVSCLRWDDPLPLVRCCWIWVLTTQICWEQLHHPRRGWRGARIEGPQIQPKGKARGWR